MNVEHVKIASPKMREEPIGSKKENKLGCIQLEVSKYTEALPKIPCSSEANVEMENPIASLNEHDPSDPMFQDGWDFVLNYSNVPVTPTDFMVTNNDDQGGLMAPTNCLNEYHSVEFYRCDQKGFIAHCKTLFHLKMSVCYYS